MLAAGLLVVLLLATGACGSGGPDEATTEQGSTTTATKPIDDQEVAGTLDLFVQAAGRGDAEAMWGLLSQQSRSRLGPTLSEFEKDYAEGFQSGLGSFAQTSYDIVLSQVTPSGWGVAAIAGTRTREGKNEYAAYAAPLARENGGWRLDLGESIRLKLNSPGRKTSEAQPRILLRARAKLPITEAGVWLDGKPVPGNVNGSGRDVFVAAKPARPLRSGRHVVVVFASTGETATAGAAPFRVEGGTNA